LSYYWYLDPARQEEFNRNIEALAKWIEGAIQRRAQFERLIQRRTLSTSRANGWSRPAVASFTISPVTPA
jgi:hypothetical protein